MNNARVRRKSQRTGCNKFLELTALKNQSEARFVSSAKQFVLLALQNVGLKS